MAHSTSHSKFEIPLTNLAMPTGLKYTDEEDRILVDLVAEHLPTGGDQWIRLTAEFQIQAGVNRDEDSLKERFKKLRNVRKPTGDPDIPSTVLKAKQVWQDILSKMAVQDLGSPVDKNVVADTLAIIQPTQLSFREIDDVQPEPYFDMWPMAMAHGT